MPPTLRSAHSSPAGKTAVFDVSPDITPGRKAPTCTKCGQPRRGHPRSGCPNAINSSPTRTKPKTLQENLNDAFGSMYLELSATTAEETRAKAYRGHHPIKTPMALQPSDTLASISSSAEDILHDLTRPGFFSQVTVPDDGDTKGSKGQDNSVPTLAPSKLKIKSGPQILMPGTLNAPSWESSIEGLPDATNNSDISKGAQLAKSSLFPITESIIRSIHSEPTSTEITDTGTASAVFNLACPGVPCEHLCPQETRCE